MYSICILSLSLSIRSFFFLDYFLTVIYFRSIKWLLFRLISLYYIENIIFIKTENVWREFYKKSRWFILNRILVLDPFKAIYNSQFYLSSLKVIHGSIQMQTGRFYFYVFHVLMLYLQRLIISCEATLLTHRKWLSCYWFVTVKRWTFICQW